MSYFKNKTLLLEGSSKALTPRQKDDRTRLLSRIKSLQKKNNGKILAFIGEFGSGKSTVINDLISSNTPKHVRWIPFDVWRYSDREQIWDGFVVEISAAIKSKGEKNKSLTEISSEIEGENKYLRIILRNKILSVFIILTIWLMASYGIWFIFHNPSNDAMVFIKSILKYATGVLFTLFALIGLSTLFPNNRPMKRFFEFEEKLLHAINSSKQPIVIVIEDVDRVGEEGVVFLETLRQFLNNNKELNVPITIIAPQSKLYLDVTSENKLQGFERGIKIYDSILYFSGSSLSTSEGMDLIKDVGIQDKYMTTKDNLLKVARLLLDRYSKRISMRTFKFILREVDEFMSAYPNAHPSIVLTLTMARHVSIHTHDISLSAIDLLSSKQQFGSSDDELRGFINGLIQSKVEVELDYRAIVNLNLGELSSNIEIDTFKNVRNEEIVRGIIIDNKYKILMS